LGEEVVTFIPLGASDCRFSIRAVTMGEPDFG